MQTATENNCDGNKWTFKPAAVYRYPENNGFDIVIVDLAVHNGSDRYWGQTQFLDYGIYITTEDGYKYSPFPGAMPIPDNPPSPYSGPETGSMNRQWATVSTAIIPPGFTTSGFPYNEDSLQLVRFTFGFEVASSQKLLTMHLTTSIYCGTPQRPVLFDALPELSYSLDDLANYPLPTSEEYPKIGSEPIVVLDFGTYEYKGLSEQDGKYALQFSFTNANGGYATKGQILSYLVGDDGLFRPSENYGDFEAGPGQTIDLIPFLITKPSGVNNLKFVFEDVINGVYMVYDFVP